MSKFNVFKFRDNGEDDGTRIYDDEMHLLCNRCNSRMRFFYDEENGVDYAICPKCDFIEIDSYDDEYDESNFDDDDYEEYWSDDEEEDEDDD